MSFTATLRRAWPVLVAYGVFSVWGVGCLFASLALTSGGFGVSPGALGVVIGLVVATAVGQVAGNLLGLAGLRLVVVAFAFTAAFILATLSGAAIGTFAVFLVVGVIAALGGYLGIASRLDVVAAWFPLSFAVGGAIVWMNRHGAVGVFKSGSKHAVWDPFTIVCLSGAVFLMLVFLATRQSLGLTVWQEVSRPRAAGPEEAVAVARPGRGSLIVLFGFSIVVLGATALVSPYLFRTRPAEQGEDGGRGKPDDKGSKNPDKGKSGGKDGKGQPGPDKGSGDANPGKGKDKGKGSGKGDGGQQNPGDGRSGDGRGGDGAKPSDGKGGPGKGGSGKGDPGKGDPGKGDPGKGTPGKGDPGKGAPDKGAPDKGDPGKGSPGKGSPGDGGGKSPDKGGGKGSSSPDKGKDPPPDPLGKPDPDRAGEAGGEALAMGLRVMGWFLALALALLVFLLMVGPPIRRVFLIRHLERPLWPVAPTSRVMNLWRRALAALAVIDIVPELGETPRDFAERARAEVGKALGCDAPGLVEAAAIVERLDYAGRGLGAGEEETMRSVVTELVRVIGSRTGVGKKVAAAWGPAPEVEP